MPNYQKDIKKLKNPENIQEALYASSPYVLIKAFQHDPTVKRLIKSGSRVIPYILKEIEKNGLKLHEITLSCYAYILQNTDRESTVKGLEKPFSLALQNPGPFFVHIAAHALRQCYKLSIKPLKVVYSQAELQETIGHIKQFKQTAKGGKNG